MAAEIKSWLEALGLGQYSGAFSEHHIDLALLRELTSDDLKELGVALGDRKRLLNAVAGLPQRLPADTLGGKREVESTQVAAGLAGAERRQLTVMFCDLVGSTALSVRFDPEDMREIIGAFQVACKNVLDRYSGYIARFMGDGLLAYFGYPRAHEIDPERAVRAGLEIAEAVPRLQIVGGLALHVRIGIATGEVVVGELIGEGESRERAVIGETPNLAARLQAIARPDHVVISEATRRLVGDLFRYTDLGLHSASGFAAPVRAWHVGDELAVDSRFEATHRGGLTPLVGRGREVSLLLERWDLVRSGQGQAVLLTGEAGIGKSRLTLALRERLGPEPYTLMRYYCVPYRNNSVLFPVINQIERAARIDRKDAPEAKLDKLEALLARSAGDPVGTAPLFADLLSIPSSGRYLPLMLSPQRRKENTMAALEAQLVALSSKRPVLVVFEDLHWVDATTMELLEDTVRWIRSARVLLLMTARPDFESPWVGDDRVTTIGLTRFERSDGAELVSGVTAGKVLPSELMELIMDKADGVPLFIEELTRTVLNSGLLEERDGHYEPSAPSLDLPVPSTLQDSLMARLDGVAQAKEVAQIGAAIGRQFSYELLAAVSDMPPEAQQKALDRLTSVDLVRCQGAPPAAVYTFRHALLQDAAYSSLLRSDRRRLHARIAAELEQRFPETAVSEPELLAHHYTRADDKRRAITYWHKAGINAGGRAAHAEALRHFRAALRLLEGLGEGTERDELELGLRVSLGVSLASTQGYATPAVQDTYERADELSRRLGREAETFPVTRNICTFYIVRDELGHARELARRCVAIAERERNPSYLVEAYTALGYVECHRGLYEQGSELLARCLDVYQRNRSSIVPLTPQDPGVASGALRSIVLWFLGRGEAARRQLQGALDLAIELNHPFHLAYVHTYCAMLAELDGEAESARSHSLEAIRLAEENGFEVWNAVGAIHLGYAKALLGESGEAIEILESAIGLYEATGARSVMPYFLTGLAEAFRRAGRLERALTTVDRALAHAETFDHHMYDSLLHRLRAEVMAAMPAFPRETVRHEFRKAVELARAGGARQLELEAALALYRSGCADPKGPPLRATLAEICSSFDAGAQSRALLGAREIIGERRT